MKIVSGITSTPIARFGRGYWEYPEPSSGAASLGSPPVAMSATRRGSALIDRFSLALLPVATVAGLAAAGWPREKRCVYSGGEFTRSAVIDVAWSIDQWQFTQERADLEEIRSLNRLLDLPAAEGLALELPDF